MCLCPDASFCSFRRISSILAPNAERPQRIEGRAQPRWVCFCPRARLCRWCFHGRSGGVSITELGESDDSFPRRWAGMSGQPSPLWMRAGGGSGRASAHQPAACAFQQQRHRSAAMWRIITATPSCINKHLIFVSCFQPCCEIRSG